jgi:uncharacterized small protein (DUF1192 family)
MIKELTYEKELGNLQKERRKRRISEDHDHLVKLIELKKKYNIPPKERAKLSELLIMIGMVLADGEGGTKVIKKYAEIHEKTDKWRSEIARPKAGKNFKKALDTYKDNINILTMKENRLYDESDVINRSVTGALRKLSIQLAISKEIDSLKNEIARLKADLAVKVARTSDKRIDWELAQQMRDEGKTLQEIANILGVGKSAVGNHTTKKKTSN